MKPELCQIISLNRCKGLPLYAAQLLRLCGTDRLCGGILDVLMYMLNTALRDVLYIGVHCLAVAVFAC